MAQGVDLLSDISYLRLKDDNVLQQIKDYMRMGIPYFAVTLEVPYPDGRLEMQLHCRQQQSTGGPYYELSQYAGTFYKKILFSEESINGISLRDLDLELSSIDWPRYFASHQTLEKSLTENNLASGAVQKLLSLSDHNNVVGRQAQELLRIKHWSNTPWDDPSLADRRRTLERYMAFDPAVQLPYTPELCYYVLSGKLDKMKSQLKEIGFNPEHYLSRMLAQGLPEFSLSLSRRRKMKLLQYQVDYKRDPYFNFNIDGCKVSLVHLPGIEHNVIEGVDTAVLEKQMAAINWKDEDSHYIVDDGDAMFTPEISRVVLDLESDLALDPEGWVIASQLQLKYWFDSPDFSAIISEDAWEYYRTLPIISATLSEIIPAEQVYHLLNGRSVYLESSEEPGWRQLRPGQANQDELVLEKVGKYSPEDLYNSLLHLPCLPEVIRKAINPLLNGCRVNLHLNSGKNIQIEADPVHETVRLYSAAGIPIHTNLLLAPDDKESKALQFPNQKREETRPPQKSFKAWFKRAKKKGKGL